MIPVLKPGQTNHLRSAVSIAASLWLRAVAFAGHCGQHEQGARDPAEAGQKWSDIRQILIFFLIDALICCVASFVEFFHTLSVVGHCRWYLARDSCGGHLFCPQLVKTCRTLLVWHNFSLSKLLGYCAIAVIGSLTVSFIVGPG